MKRQEYLALSPAERLPYRTVLPRNPAILTLDNGVEHGGPDFDALEGVRVRSHDFPGGYPLFYVTQDCGVLCPRCVEENLEECSNMDHDDDYSDPQWLVVRHEANYEDPYLYCNHCNNRIESAYADDDDDDDD